MTQLNHDPSTPLRLRLILVGANVLLFLVLAALGVLLKWSGTAFCAGIIVGAVTMAVVWRLKLGRWV